VSAVTTENPGALKPPVVTSRLTVIGPVDVGDLVKLIWREDELAGGSASAGAPLGGEWMPKRPGEPDGDRGVDFSTGGLPAAAAWERHAAFVRAVGAWLEDQGASWAWQFQDDPWLHGTVPAARGAAS
jgi:hypothetical protein